MQHATERWDIYALTPMGGLLSDTKASRVPGDLPLPLGLALVPEELDVGPNENALDEESSFHGHLGILELRC